VVDLVRLQVTDWKDSSPK